MRIVLAIVGLTAIALGVVACRYEEVRAAGEIHRLQSRLLTQRRSLWDLDVRLGRLTAVEAVAARAQDMALGVVGPDGETPEALELAVAGGDAAGSRREGGLVMDLRR